MNADNPHILVVDDDQRLRDLLGQYLGDNGFRVSTAADATDARSKLSSLMFDLIVLDRMMPGESGLEFAASLRPAQTVPILMLTAMGEPEDRIAGLEGGVDDYLTKPFEPRELVLRINAILRRVPAQADLAEDVILGEVSFHLDREELRNGDRVIRLTSVETSLLRVFSERPGIVLSREDLANLTGAAGGGRAVDVQITRLRRKIERDPREPRYLQTVRGKGYILRPD